MNDLNKRLVEVEFILKKMDDRYTKNIPKEIWEYIENNKDRDYVFYYDETKSLEEQNLSIETISILTYINMEYLLDEVQKKELNEILRKDEIIYEERKVKNYRPEDIFKNIKNESNVENSMIEIKNDKWSNKFLLFIKRLFRK